MFDSVTWSHWLKIKSRQKSLLFCWVESFWVSKDFTQQQRKRWYHRALHMGINVKTPFITLGKIYTITLSFSSRFMLVFNIWLQKISNVYFSYFVLVLIRICSKEKCHRWFSLCMISSKLFSDISIFFHLFSLVECPFWNLNVSIQVDKLIIHCAVFFNTLEYLYILFINKMVLSILHLSTILNTI